MNGYLVTLFQVCRVLNIRLDDCEWKIGKDVVGSSQGLFKVLGLNICLEQLRKTIRNLSR
jgi:hypothetical protein